MTADAGNSVSYVPQVKTTDTNSGTFKLNRVTSTSDGTNRETCISIGEAEEILTGPPLTVNNVAVSATPNANDLLQYNGSEWTNVQQVGFEMIRTSYTQGVTNLEYKYIRYDSVQFEIGGSGASTSTGLYTVPSDGLYHFNIDFNVDFGDGGDDSIGVGFVISNNSSYYNQAVGTTSPFRINPRYDSRSGIEHTYSFGKTARLSQGATIGFYISDWGNGTYNNLRLQGAHFSGFKIQ